MQLKNTTMRKYIILLLSLISISTLGQKSVDAYRYSHYNSYSTARSAGVAGAFGALGGDFASLRINPAGLGFYTHGEVSLTNGLSIYNYNQESGIINVNDFNKQKISYNLNNFGIVFSFKEDDIIGEGWNGFNIGIGYNKLNNFNTNSYTSDYNAGISFLEYTSLFAYGNSPSDLSGFSDKLFYDTHLLLPAGKDSNNKYIYGSDLAQGEKVNQFNTIYESGYQGEFILSFATNYKRKLFLGMTVGVQVLDYSSTSTYREETLPGTNSDIKNYSFIKNLDQTGYGVNIKLGAIYKPSNNISIGLAYETSTELNINEEYNSSVIANFNTNIDGKNTHIARSSFNEFDYTITVPGKATLSGAYIFGQKGFISADIEYKRFNNTRVSLDGNENEFRDINYDLSNTYKGVLNYRIGGEYRLNSILSFRTGYGFEDSPYKSTNEKDIDKYMQEYDIVGTPYQSGYINNNKYSKHTITGGLGFRLNNLYANFAYIHSFYDNSHHSFYYDNGVVEMKSTLIKQKINTNDIMVSIGFNF